jgi:hypothetical protein
MGKHVFWAIATGALSAVCVLCAMVVFAFAMPSVQSELEAVGAIALSAVALCGGFFMGLACVSELTAISAHRAGRPCGHAMCRPKPRTQTPASEPQP